MSPKIQMAQFNGEMWVRLEDYERLKADLGQYRDELKRPAETLARWDALSRLRLTSPAVYAALEALEKHPNSEDEILTSLVVCLVESLEATQKLAVKAMLQNPQPYIFAKDKP